MFKRFFGGAAVSTLALLASAPIVQAQETTATIRGEVVNASGSPVSGARVTVTHTPSGTRSVQQTNAEGIFDARGLRVGGPYKIEVTGAGGASEADNVFVSLGEPLRLTFELAGAEVVVTAARRQPIIRGVNTGASSTFNAADVQQLPSIGRDPKDIARLDPFVTLDASNSKAIIFSGTNSRYNSFTVDSVRQNDEFGLNNNGYPTQRSPVSVDAIGGISVRSAPYDVKYNDFTGGNINVVTKSGTNKFSGSLFGDITNDTFLGQQRTQIRTVNSQIVREDFNSTIEFEEKTWGATIGGPIIKDRLFFFGSYEKFDATRPFQSGPSDLNRAVITNNVTSANVRTVQAILGASATATSVTGDGFSVALPNGGYGFSYDTTNSILGAPALAETDEKKLVKIDWNVISGHRASFTYQDTFGDRLVEGNRATTTLLPLLSNYYTLSDSMKAFNAQLVSNWTNNLSTEFGFNRKEIERGQIPIGGASNYTRNGDDPLQFGQFEIDAFTATGQPTSSIFAGPDRSRHSNELDNQTDTWIARGEYTLGKYKLLGGYERKDVTVRNLFAQDTEGRVNFGTLTALASRNPSRIRYQNAIRDVNGDGQLNGKDSEVNWGYAVDTVYAQVTADFTDALTVVGGVRYDTYSSDERPQANTFFAQRYGFSNTKNLDGLDVFLPRLGFNYQVDAFTLSGGLGKFSGGSPGVWVSNNYSNDGLTLGSVDCGTAAAGTPSCTAAESTAFRTNFNGFDLPTGIRSILTDANRLDSRLTGRTLRETLVRGNGVNAMSPDFKVPSTWKANLQFNTEFGGGENPWKIRAGYLRTQVDQALMFVDLRAGAPIGVLPDGRPRYQSSRQRLLAVDPALAATNAGLTNFGTDIVLRNTEEGWSEVYTVGFGREWANGIDVDYNYTRTRAKDVQPGTSSVAFSNYQNYATSDPQGENLATSNYEIRESHKARAGWGKKFFGDNETRITIFGEIRSGLPFSYTMRGTNDDVFGDVAQSLAGGTQGRQLFYVPNFGAGVTTTGAGCTVTAPCVGNVAFANVATLDNLRAFVDRNGLSEYYGRITPRNGFRSENVAKFDVRVSQELPAFFPNGAKVRAYMDVENIGNLINTEWGQIEQIEFPQVARLVDVGLDTVNNRYIYSAYAPAQPGTSNADAPNRSVWQIKFGLAYNF